MLPEIKPKFQSFKFENNETFSFRGWNISDELNFDKTNILSFISNCMVNPEQDLERLKKLDSIDVYRLLLEIRKQSKANKIAFSFDCIDDEKCKTVNDAEFDLSIDIKFTNKEIENIETEEVLYNFKNLSIDEDISFLEKCKDIKDIQSLIIQRIVFSINYVIVEGIKYDNFTIDEMEKWFLKRPIDEKNIIMKQFEKTQKKLQLEKMCRCAICGKEKLTKAGLDFLLL